MIREDERLYISYNGKNFTQLELDSVRIQGDGTPTRMGVGRFAAKDYLDGIPSLTYSQEKSLPCVPFTAEVAKAVKKWPFSQVIYQTTTIRTKLERVLAQDILLDQNVLLQQNWKSGEQVPSEVDFVVTNDKYTLHKHQIVAAALTSFDEGGYGYFLDMGTGKTLTTIARMSADARATPELYKALVVMPGALILNWREELAQFATADLHVVNLDVGGGAFVGASLFERQLQMVVGIQKAIEKGADGVVFVITYDKAVASIDTLLQTPWDMIVLDEAQYIKNPHSKRYKAIIQLRDASKKRLVLTGTPMANHVGDLYPLLEFMDEAASGHASYESFKSAHLITKPIGHGVEAVLGSTMLGELKERLAKRSFIVTKKEVLKDLPDKTFEIASFEMCKDQERAYKQMAVDLTCKFENETGTSTEHVLTQLLRLAQITSGFTALDKEVSLDSDGNELPSERVIHHFSENNRIKLLLEMAKELPKDEKMIIWNVWTPLVTKATQALIHAGHDVAVYRGSQDKRDNAKIRFNEDPNCRFFFAHPQSAGAGLTLNGYVGELETNTTEMVFFSYNWSILQRLQAIDRANRIGSRKNLRVRTIVCPGTIDYEIYTALERKRKNAEDIQDVREILRSLSERLKGAITL